MSANNPYIPHDEEKNPYDLLEYDSIIIILKDLAKKEPLFAGHLKFDKNKNKYFLKGKAVQLMLGNISSIRILPEKHFKAYKDAKKVDDRQKLTLNVSYSLIDFIMIPFDSFDWKK